MGLLKAELVRPTADWGLSHDKGYLLFTWRIWRMSNFQVYPNGKCYDEQPQSLVDDYAELERVYSYQKHYLKDEKPE